MLLKGLKAIYEGTFWLRDIADRRKVTRCSRAKLDASLTCRLREQVSFEIQHVPHFADLTVTNQIDPNYGLTQDYPEFTKNTLTRDSDRIVTEPALSRARITEFFDRSHDPTELLDREFHVLRTLGSTGTPEYLAKDCNARTRVLRES